MDSPSPDNTNRLCSRDETDRDSDTLIPDHCVPTLLTRETAALASRVDCDKDTATTPRRFMMTAPREAPNDAPGTNETTGISSIDRSDRADSLKGNRTTKAVKACAEVGQIELVESAGASSGKGEDLKGGDKESKESGGLGGWTTWRRERDIKKKMGLRDGDRNGEEGAEIGEPLETVRSNEELLGGEDEGPFGQRRQAGGGGRGDDERGGIGGDAGPVVWKVYKRRWFGLAQLVLLNVVVSWDWLSFAPVSTTSAEYFGCSITAINWIATSFLFSFLVGAPFALRVLHTGPKQAIIIASVLLLMGNWIRYAGTKTRTLGAVYFGQILTGLAQPFVLAAPTRYSDLWFTDHGRVAATAVMSLANPFGGALGQLINPFWAEKASDVPDMILWVSIISTIAAVPSFFIPAAPPTPCSPSASHAKLAILPSLRTLLTNPSFLLIMLPFHIFVGLFNSLSSLLNSILYPFAFSEEEAGIAGAILIVVGLVTSAVTSPLIDRSKKFLLAIKLTVPIVAACYLIFIFMPPTRSVAGVYVVLALLGAASFSLVPVVLEFVTEITYPVSPEIASVVCWSGGQLLGGIFIVVSDKLADGPAGGPGGDTPYNMQRALWFHAVVGVAVAGLPLCLGLRGREGVRLRRLEADGEFRRRNEAQGV